MVWGLILKRESWVAIDKDPFQESKTAERSAPLYLLSLGCWCKLLFPHFLLLLRGQPAIWVMVSTPKPFTNSHLSPRYSTLPGRRALKNSRLVSQKDDVHVCILCLRAIMNYQVRGQHQPWVLDCICLFCQTRRARRAPALTDGFAGGPVVKKSRICLSHHHGLPSFCLFPLLQYGFNLVMSHPHAVNEIALSLNNKNPR